MTVTGQQSNRPKGCYPLVVGMKARLKPFGRH